MYKIVIIDDNELTRRSIAKTIKRRLPDCSVVGDASDGREGLSCIQSVSYTHLDVYKRQAVTRTATRRRESLPAGNGPPC